MDASKRNFIRQQGFAEPSPASCPLQFSALLFQPRLVVGVVLLGMLLQSAAVFLVLSLALWWSSVFPRLNPFEIFYNRTWARRPGRLRLTPAPAPRRFAQGMGGAVTLAVVVFLARGWTGIALVAQAFMLLAASALAFGRFCLGSWIYHHLRGQGAFARSTLPWSRS